MTCSAIYPKFGLTAQYWRGTCLKLSCFGGLGIGRIADEVTGGKIIEERFDSWHRHELHAKIWKKFKCRVGTTWCQLGASELSIAFSDDSDLEIEK